MNREKTAAPSTAGRSAGLRRRPRKPTIRSRRFGRWPSCSARSMPSFACRLRTASRRAVRSASSPARSGSRDKLRTAASATSHPRRTSGRLMATEQTRQLVRLAYAQTCASGLEAPGSRQVLLGILRTDSGAARALKAEGITLVNALACEPANHTPADAGSLRRILRRAGRIALGRGQYMRPEEVLLAALADAD